MYHLWEGKVRFRKKKGGGSKKGLLRSAGAIRTQGFPAKYSKKPVLCILALLQTNVAARYLYNRNRDVVNG